MRKTIAVVFDIAIGAFIGSWLTYNSNRTAHMIREEAMFNAGRIKGAVEMSTNIINAEIGRKGKRK